MAIQPYSFQSSGLADLATTGATGLTAFADQLRTQRTKQNQAERDLLTQQMKVAEDRTTAQLLQEAPDPAQTRQLLDQQFMNLYDQAKPEQQAKLAERYADLDRRGLLDQAAVRSTDLIGFGKAQEQKALEAGLDPTRAKEIKSFFTDQLNPNLSAVDKDRLKTLADQDTQALEELKLGAITTTKGTGSKDGTSKAKYVNRSRPSGLKSLVETKTLLEGMIEDDAFNFDIENKDIPDVLGDLVNNNFGTPEKPLYLTADEIGALMIDASNRSIFADREISSEELTEYVADYAEEQRKAAEKNQAAGRGWSSTTSKTLNPATLKAYNAARSKIDSARQKIYSKYERSTPEQAVRDLFGSVSKQTRPAPTAQTATSEAQATKPGSREPSQGIASKYPKKQSTIEKAMESAKSPAERASTKKRTFLEDMSQYKGIPEYTATSPEPRPEDFPNVQTYNHAHRQWELAQPSVVGSAARTLLTPGAFANRFSPYK